MVFLLTISMVIMIMFTVVKMRISLSSRLRMSIPSTEDHCMRDISDCCTLQDTESTSSIFIHSVKNWLPWHMSTTYSNNHMKSTVTIRICTWYRVFNIFAYRICWRYWCSRSWSSSATIFSHSHIYRCSCTCNIVRSLFMSFHFCTSQWHCELNFYSSIHL